VPLQIAKSVHSLLKYSYVAKEDVIRASSTMTMGTRSVSKAVRGMRLGAPGNATILFLALVTFSWAATGTKMKSKFIGW